MGSKLTASATVASRVVNFVLDDGSTIITRSRNSTNVTATFIGNAFSIPGVTQASTTAGANIYQTIPLPEVWLPEGCRIRSITEAIQAGDQWSDIRIAVLER